jgi:hypothetical protein
VKSSSSLCAMLSRNSNGNPLVPIRSTHKVLHLISTIFISRLYSKILPSSLRKTFIDCITIAVLLHHTSYLTNAHARPKLELLNSSITFLVPSGFETNASKIFKYPRSQESNATGFDNHCALTQHGQSLG